MKQTSISAADLMWILWFILFFSISSSYMYCKPTTVPPIPPPLYSVALYHSLRLFLSLQRLNKKWAGFRGKCNLDQEQVTKLCGALNPKNCCSKGASYKGEAFVRPLSLCCARLTRLLSFLVIFKMLLLLCCTWF